jgi:hypothetical protein
MPGLYVTYHQKDGAAAGVRDGFTIAGGGASGTVAWTAWATRRAVELQKAQTAAGRTSTSASTAAGVEPGDDAAWARPAPSRVSRRTLRLPVR